MRTSSLPGTFARRLPRRIFLWQPFQRSSSSTFLIWINWTLFWSRGVLLTTTPSVSFVSCRRMCRPPSGSVSSCSGSVDFWSGANCSPISFFRAQMAHLADSTYDLSLLSSFQVVLVSFFGVWNDCAVPDGWVHWEAPALRLYACDIWSLARCVHCRGGCCANLGWGSVHFCVGRGRYRIALPPPVKSNVHNPNPPRARWRSWSENQAVFADPANPCSPHQFWHHVIRLSSPSGSKILATHESP